MDNAILEQQARLLLTNLPPGAKIEIKTPQGKKLSVTKQPDVPQYATKTEWLEAEYKDLVGQPITLSEAAQKYDVPRSTITSWVDRSNYLDPLDPNAYPATFNEAEIAALVDIYSQRRAINSKAPLLNSAGLPYIVKRPDIAAYRRAKKETD